MSDEKSLIRKKLIYKRKKLFNKKYNFLFKNIINFINKEFKSKKKINIGLYYPTNFEVNVFSFFKNVKKKKYILSLPMVLENYQMTFKKWKPNQSLYLNRYGIPEPHINNSTIKPDIILVPLVGYDKKLNRLGYGGGYYDRYLKKLSKENSFLTVGVGFSFQQCDYIPTNKNDYPLDFVLNEKKIIYKL